MSSICHFSYILVKKNLECPRAKWDNWKSNDKQLADSASECGTRTLHLSEPLKITVALAI
jgi:hypothetical protein